MTDNPDNATIPFAFRLTQYQHIPKCPSPIRSKWPGKHAKGENRSDEPHHPMATADPPPNLCPDHHRHPHPTRSGQPLARHVRLPARPLARASEKSTSLPRRRGITQVQPPPNTSAERKKKTKDEKRQSVKKAMHDKRSTCHTNARKKQVVTDSSKT